MQQHRFLFLKAAGLFSYVCFLDEMNLESSSVTLVPGEPFSESCELKREGKTRSLLRYFPTIRSHTNLPMSAVKPGHMLPVCQSIYFPGSLRPQLKPFPPWPLPSSSSCQIEMTRLALINAGTRLSLIITGD